MWLIRPSDPNFLWMVIGRYIQISRSMVHSTIVCRNEKVLFKNRI